MDQYKTSEDLDVYEFDYHNSRHLQDACDIRQPILFNLDNVAPNFFYDLSITNIAKYGSLDMNLKSTNVYYKPDSCLDPLPLPFNQIIKIIETDQNAEYFSEQNSDFLEDSGLQKSFFQLDPYIKPEFNINTKYDLMTGSVNTSTPLRYHTNYRHFMCVLSGKIHIKMAPWKNVKRLHPIHDFEFYEFYSPVHPSHPSVEYLSDFEKINFLHFDVIQGQCLYIPPYWWYSVQYIEHNTFVGTVHYTTIMNMVANFPDISRYYLQQQNITKTITKSSNQLSGYSDILPNKPSTEIPSIKIETQIADDIPSTESFDNELQIEDSNIVFEEEIEKSAEHIDMQEPIQEIVE
jgi:hypothetical protein